MVLLVVKIASLLVILLPLCRPYTQKALEDQITYMPGAQDSFASNQFSGYLQVAESKFVHYIYYESERDPEKDSIVFWTNGGPGTFNNL